MTRIVPHSKPFVDEHDIASVSQQVKSGMHATGDKVKEFENEVAKILDRKFAKATNSGTTAIHIALLSLGVKKGDEVIIPNYVCHSVMDAVMHAEATPIFADISKNPEKDGYNITAETVKKKITSRTKAIIVPHMFGKPAPIKQINKLNIPVVEDCCQSFGATINGKPVGSFGKVSICSFYATKVISTGHGGMVLTSDEETYERIKDLTTYDGRENQAIAFNYAFTNIQAALGLSQLKKLDLIIKKRRNIGEIYKKFFANLTSIKHDDESFPFRYIVRLKNEDELKSLQEKLKAQGIHAARPVFKPLHRYFNLPDADYPNSIKAHETALSIPIYPSLEEDDIDYVIKFIVKNT